MQNIMFYIFVFNIWFVLRNIGIGYNECFVKIKIFYVFLWEIVVNVKILFLRINIVYYLG